MPLWIFTLGKQLLVDAKIRIPYVNLIVSLVLLTITIGMGILIQIIRPNWADKLKKMLKPFTAVLMTCVIIGGTWINLYAILLMTWSVVIAGLSVALGGYFTGAVMAMIFGLGRRQVIAVSIETALQNPGIAFVLLQLSLDQPEADLAAIPIMGQLFMTGIPLWITFLIYTIARKIMNRIQTQEFKENMDHDKNSKIVVQEKSFTELNTV